ncbi:MAG: 8-oxo-dGTP diphosphatase MutT, partial [Woeseiaceae bacterium]|nr:8-oxo-dGTP diphosphatase MutT [Woeseiaceae bacterium]NIP21565.1 8-oxo-dGTP diphosphatase MutT [Woeseiaceae bacterium]
RITVSEPFMDLCHEYPDRTVEIEFFLVSGWQGEPLGLEGQQIRWVAVSE